MSIKQKQSDHKAIRPHKTVGHNTSKDEPSSTAADQNPKIAFNGIRISDAGPDTWKVGQGLK